jgi:MFS family permease
MRAFLVVWAGQVVSLVGTGMTQFAYTIWAWEVTGEATALALVGFFSFGPAILVSPFAGALVDRWNRKLVMMLSDLAAGLSSIAILLLYLSGDLAIWHLYVAGAFAGVFQSFQFPAYSAAVTTMLPKQQYARASGLLSLANSTSQIIAPVLAAGLLGVIGMGGVLSIDIVTFVVAVGALLVVHIPQPEATTAGREGRGSLWQESLYGFQYILARPSLFGLLVIFFAINLISTFGFTLMNPMILARTGNNEDVLAAVQMTIGIGGVVGGLVLSVWGGPKRKMHGILIGLILLNVLGVLPLGLGRALPVWAVAGFSMMVFTPTINGSSQAIWQAKVAPDVQGRVFAARRLIAQISAPLSMLLAGPLADRVFEPALLAEGGQLASAFGWLVGTGPGAGMALMFVVTAIAGALVSAAGYALPAVRAAEDILPDYDASAAPPPAAAPATI